MIFSIGFVAKVFPARGFSRADLVQYAIQRANAVQYQVQNADLRLDQPTEDYTP